MSRILQLSSLGRTYADGSREQLKFEPGANIIVGPPNSGKTMWLKMLDFMLGDPDSFQVRFGGFLARKYRSVELEFFIGSDAYRIRRMTQERGVRSKIYLNGSIIDTSRFQKTLLSKLDIPNIKFPKGSLSVENSIAYNNNWADISFRTLYRHIYRQQRFWSDLADRQFDSEKNACLLHFLGIAEDVFSSEILELQQLFEDRRRMLNRNEAFCNFLDNAIRNSELIDKELIFDEAQSVRNDLHFKIGKSEFDRSIEKTNLIKDDIEKLCKLNHALGSIEERERLGNLLSRAISKGERRAAEIEREIHARTKYIPFSEISATAIILENSMNEYISYINDLEPKTWRHSKISIKRFSKHELRFLVDNLSWNKALGGTESLLFLTAYHYGLMSLSSQSGCNYPGLSIIDLPASILGQNVSGKEALVLAPFIKLLKREEFSDCQVIAAGLSFGNALDCHRIELRDRHENEGS